jgi:transcriptional regulator GlxA family with amidase domain
MKTVSILVPESSVMQAIADPQYLFNTVNQFLAVAGKPALFNVQLTGVKKEVKLNGGLYSVHTDLLITDVKKTDLIIIPALFGNMQQAIEANKKLKPWIVDQYNKGSEVASLCVGAFMLASTGLLSGKKCSTHWGFTNQFREMFPDVEVVDGSIITEEKRLYSSGGANSYWNLLLHLVEKYTNRETAILASKYFAIDIDRESQSAFALFQGQKSHNDEVVLKAQEYIEKNVTQKFSVDELAATVAVGRRSFERRFKLATNNTVLEYMQRVKIEAAKRSFESSRKNISEVMFDVGYTDTKAFRSIFKKITGLSPAEYRNKYNKLA